MSIPSQSEMFKYVLETMASFPEFTRAQAKNAVCERLGLTEEEKAQKTGSGVPVYASRVGWAVSGLNSAAFLEKIRKAVYRITSKGREILQRNLSLDEFLVILRENQNADAEPADPATPAENPLSPMEQVDSALQELREGLSDEIMQAILAVEGREGDTFFEKIVTDLLEKMGYGRGFVTPPTGDGGIDGVIRTDPLGFNPIFIQAKRYSQDHTVGRPEIQSFAGALGAITRGAFFTTSRFTSGAVDFARNYPHSDIILIDGKKLTELMIEYNLGVTVEREFTIKRMDSDYFEG